MLQRVLKVNNYRSNINIGIIFNVTLVEVNIEEISSKQLIQISYSTYNLCGTLSYFVAPLIVLQMVQVTPT